MRAILIALCLTVSSLTAFAQENPVTFEGAVLLATKAIYVKDDSGKVTRYTVPKQMNFGTVYKDAYTQTGDVALACHYYLGRLVSGFTVKIQNDHGKKKMFHLTNTHRKIDVYGNCGPGSTRLFQMHLNMR